MADGKDNKRIAKNTLYLYTQMIVILVVGLYTSRVTLMALGVSDYGIYNVVGGIVTMFVFINYAMVNSTQRYITFELGKGDSQRLSIIFSTSMNIHAAIALIIVILSETIGLWFFYNKMIIPINRLTAAFWIFQFSIISCVVNIMSVPYNALIIAHEKMSAFAYISLIDAILKLFVVFLVLNFKGDKLIMYGALLLLISIADRLIYGYYCKKNYKESKYRRVFNKSLTMEMMKFASWNLVGNLSYICYTQGLNLLLNVFFNPIVNAARGIAVQIQSIVANFSYNIENAIKPQITKSYANNDMNRMQTLMSLSARMSYFVLLYMSLPLVLEIDQVLGLWLREVPDHTSNFVRLTIFILMADALTGPLLTAAQSTGNIKNYQLTVSILSFLILPVSYLALLFWPIPELVFFVSLVITLLIQFVKLYVVGRQLKLSMGLYVKNVFGRALAVTLISIIAPTIYWSINEMSYIRLAFVILISVISVPIVIYYIGISKWERKMVLDKVMYYRNRLHLH